MEDQKRGNKLHAIGSQDNMTAVGLLLPPAVADALPSRLPPVAMPGHADSYCVASHSACFRGPILIPI